MAEWWESAPVVDAPSQGGDDWYTSAPVVTGGEIASDVAAATERHLDTSSLTYKAPDSGTAEGWIARFGRTTSLGTTDAISAAIMKYAPDFLGGNDVARGASYSDVLQAIRTGYAKDRSVTAEIAGSLVPAGIVARGVGMAAKAGMVEGATKWAVRQKPVSRWVEAAAFGGTTGAVEEAIRESVNQTIGAVAGEGFSPDDIIDATAQGAIVGAALTPVGDAAVRGTQAAYRWAAAALGGQEAQTLQATKRLIHAIRLPGENADQAVERLQKDVRTFVEDNGRPPALAEIMAPEKVQDLSDVVRYFSGLGQRARELSEEQIDRAVEGFDRIARGNRPLADTEVLESNIEDLFTTVIKKFGNRQVAVPGAVVDALSRNKGFLETQGRTSEEARRILKVVEAREQIEAFRTRAERLKQNVSIADAQYEVKEMKDRLAELISDEFNASEVAPSEIAALRNMIQLFDAREKLLAADIKAGRAEYDRDAFMPTLRAAERILQDYENNGLKITLSAANNMRVRASSDVRTVADPNAREMARAVRDAMTRVGVPEVPVYGKVVKAWGKVLTRAEAQESGRQAVKGGVSPDNLGVRVDKGRLPDKPRAIDTNDVRVGVEEGARLGMSDAARGTRAETYDTVRRISESRNVQDSLRKAIPGEGEKMIGSAKQTAKSIENLKAMQGRSPSELREEVAATKEAALTMFAPRAGGAALAGLFSRMATRSKIPRGVATKLVEMLADPNQVEQALTYMQKRGVNLTEFFATLIAAQDQ